MPKDPKTESKGGRVAFALSLFWVLLLLLVRILPPDGREHGTWGEFLGRFHPLVVHLPVALLVLVPFMEVVARRRQAQGLAQAAGWVLGIAAAAALVAALDGWLLAWSGGFRGRDVTRHLWGGVGLCAAATAALAARGFFARAYPVLLAACVILVAWTGHFGGALSHGDDYLTQKMPAALRSVFFKTDAATPEPSVPPAPEAAVPPKDASGNISSADPASPQFYILHIDPLFQRSCVQCHKPTKHKGGLRMDTLEQLLKGGSDGPVVVAGKPEQSDLVRRLHLPPSDDDYMPSDGARPLTPEETQLIERWIRFGVKGH